VPGLRDTYLHNSVGLLGYDTLPETTQCHYCPFGKHIPVTP